MRPRDARYAALPLDGHPEVDASLAYVVACWPVSDPLYRYTLAKAGGQRVDRQVARRVLGHRGSHVRRRPPLILERGEPVELPPVLVIQRTVDTAHPLEMQQRLVDWYRKRGGEIDMPLYDNLPSPFRAQPGVPGFAARGRHDRGVHQAAGLTRMAVLGAVALLLIGGSAPFAQASSNHFYPGYCTSAAADEAQRAWGLWVPWYGDAGDWAAGARAAGWHVSPTPQAQSIAAMPRGVQGSGPDGHVGWVLAVSADGSSVSLRSQNWQGFGIITVHDVLVDGRVQFISPPASGDD